MWGIHGVNNMIFSVRVAWFSARRTRHVLGRRRVGLLRHDEYLRGETKSFFERMLA
jgi:hypothetical protein